MVLGEEDRWVWKGGGDQLFSVNSAYSLVRRDCEADLSPIFRKLWNCKAVPSALFTAWRVMENKIATRVNLERRGVMLESYLCCLCGKEKSPIVTCFSTVFLLGGSGVSVSSGWECHSCITMILSQTLLILG